jgi:hypothetical protein
VVVAAVVAKPAAAYIAAMGDAAGLVAWAQEVAS